MIRKDMPLISTIKDIYKKRPYDNELTSSLIDWYTANPIHLIGERHALATMAMYKHPLVKGKEMIITRGILELNETKNKYPNFDLSEMNVLIAREDLEVPLAYKDVKEVFISYLRYIAYGRVEYWNPTIGDIKKAREIVISAYRDYYEKLFLREDS